MQLWRVFLQHDDEASRTSEFVIEAKDAEGAARRAKGKYGARWVVYDIKPEPDPESE